jgi:tRNA(Ile)-lysidine synthase
VGGWIVDADVIDADDARRAIASRAIGDDVAYFDADVVSTPLVARVPEPGDRVRPFGLGGRKKLSDLFIDRKVPHRRRSHALVVEGRSIHWVAGVATGEEGRVGPATKRVVRLKATRG